MVLGKVDHPSSFMTSFLNRCGGSAVIDGGLATELERHGANLNDPLWSAKCLISSPHLIRRVHLDYLEAGANIIISSSYQATLQGFEEKGISRTKGESLLEKSVKIACEARDIYREGATKGSWDIPGDRIMHEQRPILVAASVGSYGAFLADGSEYSGIYGDGISLETLKDFHRRRVHVLAAAGADLIAFETIPNKLEAKAFAELLEEGAINIPAWFSFSCKDETNVASGDSIEECALIADSCGLVVGVGVNCTAPRYIHGLIQSIKKVHFSPLVGRDGSRFFLQRGHKTNTCGGTCPNTRTRTSQLLSLYLGGVCKLYWYNYSHITFEKEKILETVN
ncbi:hypothetical protein ACS0TY_027485 [Phlomoides rotata]